MRFAAFDIESARGFPDNTDWQDFAPIGISCAAIAYSKHGWIEGTGALGTRGT